VFDSSKLTVRFVEDLPEIACDIGPSRDVDRCLHSPTLPLLCAFKDLELELCAQPHHTILTATPMTWAQVIAFIDPRGLISHQDAISVIGEPSHQLSTLTTCGVTAIVHTRAAA
jgi:hypothetical protein